MGDKLECPACGSYTSSVLSAVEDGRPCPNCGLSADAHAEISAIQRLQVELELRDRLTDALKRQDELERENQALREAITNIKSAVSDLQGTLREYSHA